MKYQHTLLFVFFLLAFVASAHATTFTVEKGARVCDENGCYNDSVMLAGLQHIPPPLLAGVRSIAVRDQACSGNQTFANSPDGRITISACNLTTTEYRAAVIRGLEYYYEHPPLKHELPSWMPQPGQCDMGQRVADSRGRQVCLRYRGR